MAKIDVKQNRTNGWRRSKQSAMLVSLFVISCSSVTALPRPSSAAQSARGSELRSGQRGFATASEAADALIQAAGEFDVPALAGILGPDGKDLISSGDAVRDRNIGIAFAAKAREKHELTADPENPKRAILSVGKDNWPLPIPIVERGTKWFFDTKAGRQEILFRRIGTNELDAIEICRGYVEAQQEYASQAHGGVNQYAQHIISTPGTHDGLAWKNSDGSWSGPVGEAIAKVLAQGYTNRTQPYHGYFFKVLKAQGPAAPLGQMNFVVDGAMIGGFALVAAPAHYRVTGVKTFLVGYQGIVYQKDLGPNTLAIFKSMRLYNPDKTWSRTDDSW